MNQWNTYVFEGFKLLFPNLEAKGNFLVHS